MSRRLNSRGFTLVESIIALVVSSAIITVLVVFTISSITNFSTATTRAYLLDQAQLGLDVIKNDIRLSASADQANRHPDNHAPDAPDDLFSWQGDNQTLILATAVEDEAGNILFADPSEYISHKNNSIYYLDGGSLYKRVLAADVEGNKAVTTCPPAAASSSCPADRLILENVDSLTLSYRDGEDNAVAPANARSVEVAVTLRQTKFGRDIEVSYQSRMVFRND